MDNKVRGLLDTDRTLHEPARLIIAAILYTAEKADFLYLLRETGLTKGNLSSHLSKLENAGYVKIEKMFQGKVPRTLCQLTPTGRTAFDRYRIQLKSAANALPEIIETDEDSSMKQT